MTPTRDLNFVDDTVAGLIACGTAPDIEGQAFNLGSGIEISIGDLAARVCALLGVPCRLETEERRLRPAASEVVQLCADSRRACEALGWTPAVPLEEGLKRTAHWLKESPPERWVTELQL